MRVRTLSWMSLGLLLSHGVANAAVLLGTTLNPVGFTGLIINGISYDATFSTNSYNALFTGAAPPPIFASNPSNVFLAEAPLSNLLNAAGVTGLGGVPCAARQEKCMIFIPTTTFTSGSGQVTTNGAFSLWSAGSWINGAGDPGLLVSAPGGDAVCFSNGCDFYLEYAVLQVTPIPPPVSHSVKYTVAVLGKLSGGTYTQAAAINNTGEVAGSGDELTSLNGGVLAAVRSAIVWNGTIPTAIAHGEPDYVFNAASPSASAINNSGAAVGSFHNQTGAFFWSAGSLSTLPGKFQLAFANGISDTGQIVGNSTPFEAQPLSATFWASATSDPTELGVLAGFSGGTSVAYGINTAGKIVGNSSGNSSGKSVSRATLWLGTAVTDLGTLGGASSGAAAINALGHIVGWADIGNNTAHAALWEPTTRAFDLGTLGGNGSYARGINVEGDVVGSAQTRFGVWHAVLWTHKHFTAVDLNAEISIAESQAITLTEAVGTNGKCAIVANGYDNKTKTAASFVLSLANQANCNQQ